MSTSDPRPFIEAATAINCASYDREHESELQKARMLYKALDEPIRRQFLPAVITGDAISVRNALVANPSLANEPTGPRSWPPMLYLCFSRFFRDQEATVEISGLIDVGAALIEAGADANAFFMLGDEKETALYGACGVSNNPELASILINAGAEVNDGEVAYHSAEFDQHDCIRVLFESGMDEDNRATVLLRKLDFEDPEGVTRILQWGGNPNATGRWGKTPLHQAIMRGRSDAVLRILLDHGADPNIRRRDGQSTWYLARKTRRPEILQLLAAANADQTLSLGEQLVLACIDDDEEARQRLAATHAGTASPLSDNDNVALVEQSRAGRTRTVQNMLDVGFNIDTRDDQGFTALHWAALRGHLEIAELLIANGAPLEVKNNYGGTVIDSTVWGVTQSNGNREAAPEIIRALAAAGADVGAINPFPTGDRALDQLLLELGR